MSQWFVYVDIDYYPWGEVVEADTAEEAANIERAGSHDSNGDWAVVVTPLRNVSAFAGDARKYRLEEWGFVPPDQPEASAQDETQGTPGEGA